MDINKIKQWIRNGDVESVELAWLEAIEQTVDIAEAQNVLKSLRDAKRSPAANELALMLLEAIQKRDGQVTAMEAVVDLLPLLEGDDKLREIAAGLYRHVHGKVEHFDAFLKASGLQANQSLSRAVRTLETSLTALPGVYLADRYGDSVARVEQYDDLMGQFTITLGSGEQLQLEPKLLGDEFAVVDETDFRVLSKFRKDELKILIKKDPGAVLVGLCKARDGKINVGGLKEALVGKYLNSSGWSGWWSRARTAVRRSALLSIEGRPAVVSYHPNTRSLEDEMAGPAAEARVPLDHLAVLQQYASEVAFRKLQIEPTFVQPILDKLADQAGSFRYRRPSEAIEAALSLDAAAAMGMPAPGQEYPSAGELIDATDDPVEALWKLEEPSLWEMAIKTIAAREDAASSLARLLPAAPVGQMDDIAECLRKAGHAEVIDEVANAALTSPAANALLLVWLWQGPAKKVQAAQDKRVLLSRLFTMMDDVARNENISKVLRRSIVQQARSAMIAKKCKTFRKAILQMDVDMAGAIKRSVERNEGLTLASREDLLEVLRTEFYALFAKIKIDPWLDENVIWTTEDAMVRYRVELKELFDITMPANARDIGAAAERGDLSENSEWKFAMEEKQRYEARAKHMKNELLQTRIIDPDRIPLDVVGIGSKVALRPDDGGDLFELSFLGPWDADLERSIYNYKAPVSQEHMGKKLGEKVQLTIDGMEKGYTIEQIGSAFDTENNSPPADSNVAQ